MSSQGENQTKQISKKAKRNYYVDIISILPFVLLIITGFIMLYYHAGEPFETLVFGLNGDSWLLVHQIISVPTFVIISIHLILHFQWLKKLFTGKLKDKHKIENVLLLVFFLLAAISSLLSWLIIDDEAIQGGLRGMHNKFGMLMMVFFILHFVNYFAWLKKMTLKIFPKTFSKSTKD